MCVCVCVCVCLFVCVGLLLYVSELLLAGLCAVQLFARALLANYDVTQRVCVTVLETDKRREWLGGASGTEQKRVNTTGFLPGARQDLLTQQIADSGYAESVNWGVGVGGRRGGGRGRREKVVCYSQWEPGLTNPPA